MEIFEGNIAKSKAGRDKGRLFVVIKVIDDKYVLIADGELRKAEKPKKKKNIHLQFYNKAVDLQNISSHDENHLNSSIRKLIISVANKIE
ncbi:MAG: RNA-binding protein [Bacillota bacterium]